MTPPADFSTDLLTAASLHFNAVLPRALFLEYNVCENPMLREVIRNPVRLDADGFIPVPQGPGLGIDVDESAVRRFCVPHRFLRHDADERVERRLEFVDTPKTAVGDLERGHVARPKLAGEFLDGHVEHKKGRV